MICKMSRANIPRLNVNGLKMSQFIAMSTDQKSNIKILACPKETPTAMLKRLGYYEPPEFFSMSACIYLSEFVAVLDRPPPTSNIN